MTQVRYRDLTQEQKDFICNGCGGKGGWFQPPQFIFNADCNHHDFQYFIGCSEVDRKKADEQFYEEMIKDANHYHWLKRTFYKLMAFTYYRAVRQCGKKFFYYADKEHTLEDLLETIKKG